MTGIVAKHNYFSFLRVKRAVSFWMSRCPRLLHIKLDTIGCKARAANSLSKVQFPIQTDNQRSCVDERDKTLREEKKCRIFFAKAHASKTQQTKQKRKKEKKSCNSCLRF